MRLWTALNTVLSTDVYTTHTDGRTDGLTTVVTLRDEVPVRNAHENGP